MGGRAYSRAAAHVNILRAERYSDYAMTTTELLYDEAAIVADAQRGDRAAFGMLVKAHQKGAYAIAYGFVRNREDALELAQEAFAKAYKAMDRFDTSMPFYPWLYRIVKNTCLNHLKKRKRRGETSLDGIMESGFDVVAADPSPGHCATMNELRAAIAHALDRLSDDHREMITLRHIHELSYAEIANCLGIPQGTVMSRLHAARKSLRDAFDPRELESYESEN